MGNLKLKIVLTAVMLVFAIVPAVIVGAIGTFSVMGYERSAKENTLQQVGESKSAGIKQAFKSYSSIVGAIAKSEAAVDVAHGMGSADAELEAAVAADPDILDMMILDDSGTVIEAVNGSEGGVFENLPMNDQGVINMPSVSEMLNWTSYGDAIFVADPIPSDNASGEAGYVVAIVSAGPDSAVMKALSGQFVNLSGASFMIVDKNGVAVNYKQSGSINKEFAGSALQSDIAQFFDTSNSGYSDLKNSKDIKSIKGSAGGSTYFVGLAGTDVMNWRWVASADNAAFSQFSTTTNLLGWVVVAASAVVFSIASLLVIGRFLGNMNGMLKTMTEISDSRSQTEEASLARSRPPSTSCSTRCSSARSVTALSQSCLTTCCSSGISTRRECTLPRTCSRSLTSTPTALRFLTASSSTPSWVRTTLKSTSAI